MIKMKYRLFILTVVMVLVGLSVGGIALTLLYRATINEKKADLENMAVSIAKLIEKSTLHQFEEHDVSSNLEHYQVILDYTITHLSELQQDFYERGCDEEIVIGRLNENKEIEFLFCRRCLDGEQKEHPVHKGYTVHIFHSVLAEPMRQALINRKSGVVAGPDYEGKEVLASYEYIPSLDIGMVIKVNFSEIRKPFIRTSIMIGVSTICILAIGVVISSRIGKSLIRRLENINSQLSKEISDRQRMQDRLSENEYRMRMMFESVQAGIMLIDGETLTIEDINPAGAEIAGAERPEQIIGLKYSDVVVTDGNCLDGGEKDSEILNDESVLKRNDGQKIPIIKKEIRVLIYGKNHLLVSFVDILERKELEENILHAKEQAERANRLKTDFLSNVSHELRTPLHVILNFSKFGINKYATATKEKLLDYFTRIQEGGERLLSFVNNLLDIAKLESGKIEFSFEPVNISELIQKAVQEIKPLSNEKRLNVVIEESETTGSVTCDSGRITQVLTNLLSNAIKFSPDGGNIFVCLEQKCDAEKISICDEGPGLPETELESVFDKFVQSSKTQTGAGGTGLGLAICKEIVGGHGGRIWAENRENGGARFSFEIPRIQVSQCEELFEDCANCPIRETCTKKKKCSKGAEVI